jgi:hypothetical protein
VSEKYRAYGVVMTLLLSIPSVLVQPITAAETRAMKQDMYMRDNLRICGCGLSVLVRQFNKDNKDVKTYDGMWSKNV